MASNVQNMTLMYTSSVISPAVCQIS